MIFTIIIGFLVAFLTSRLTKLKDSAQGGIYGVIMYLFEATLCIIKKTVKIYSNNAIISIILMLVIPFIILFVFYIVTSIIDLKHKRLGYTDNLLNHLLNHKDDNNNNL